ncbi:5-dehydro-4-deoxy-D-glucuronate isomerase [Natronogracilivirga saccharolytica]|uniref:4-deoxy-L-threo-5-hexosulose-uronate ketol-isomerase n=1 Tax=Natronogracilivirga saccharolytica TaxID=2812953 RepID=A0A8J7UUQ4_9BACT|nr:5-dehydro-4-deoxy-D-glucuronate isomerase [Natronogracilivirga saccharolytica]MBP3193866.1 5-dehydro-4-deoxy-D-glucuronate isomerase [Natronogracilivirga saccharolytica]
MEIRHSVGKREVKNMKSQDLRDHFLVEDLMKDNKIQMVYSHYDRIIIGGAVSDGKELELETSDELKSDYFLERRELGIILISGEGLVTVDGEKYTLEEKECLYVGRGKKSVVFSGRGKNEKAKFYFTSTPAHTEYPVAKMGLSEAESQYMGSAERSNERTINKYIHPDGIKSCQLMMGFTVLKKGSIWNTMPPHLHERRMEAYFYCDLPEDDRIWHFMGEFEETRHMLVANNQAIISPPWSIHSGAGTSNYCFVWAMAGENQSFSDMDAVPLDKLK